MKNLLINTCFLSFYILLILIFINNFDALGNVIGTFSFLFVPLAFCVYLVLLFWQDLGISRVVKVLIVLSIIFEFIIFIYHINTYGDLDQSSIERLGLGILPTFTGIIPFILFSFISIQLLLLNSNKFMKVIIALRDKKHP